MGAPTTPRPIVGRGFTQNNEDDMVYKAMKTKDKYFEQLSLGLFWCVYMMHTDRRVVAWCSNQFEAENIATLLNEQVGVA